MLNTDNKQRIIDIIDSKKATFIKCADHIWETPETRFATKESVQQHYQILEAEGFKIDKGIANMDYAYIATYGSGQPVIGILAEYDALGNLSQVADLPEKKPLVPGGNGHGCGHNLLGTAALAAAVGIKDLMAAESISGTIKLFGCPAEESGYGKAFMARDGIFDGLDLALAWHPMDQTQAWGDNSLAVIQCYYEFQGISAHAAAAPEQGRSALDAAELMNVGIQFLREHVIDSARIHYAFIDAGGESANVVQPSAKLYYFIRAPKVEQAQEVFERVNKVAEGAALMTETKLNRQFDSACANYIPNRALTNAMDKNLDLVPMTLTDSEMAYEQKYFDTVPEGTKQNLLKRAQQYFPDKSNAEIQKIASMPLNTKKFPLEFTNKTAGSTDVGDVSWVVPTAQVMIGTEPQGTPPHSWQWVANGKSSVAHKGMLTAAKVIALTAYDALQDPQLIAQAKADFKADLNGQNYHSAIPKEVVPK